MVQYQGWMQKSAGKAQESQRLTGYSARDSLPVLWFGPWLSLVERLLGVQEVTSSNLVGPTIFFPANITFYTCKH